MKRHCFGLKVHKRPGVICAVGAQSYDGDVLAARSEGGRRRETPG